MSYLDIQTEIMESLYLETDGSENGDCPEVTEALNEGDFYNQPEIDQYIEEVEDLYTTSVDMR